MRIAAHGIISNSGYSSGGALCLLLKRLLELGHDVDFYGVPGYTHPKQLEECKNYRFVPLHVPWITAAYNRWGHSNHYAASIVSAASHVGMQREGVVRIEGSGRPYDFVFCTDTLNTWQSRLPMISWPQSPPQTEWAALRRSHIARLVIENDGPAFYAAVQGFYAYRLLLARAQIKTSDIILSGSPWAYQHWLKCGMTEEGLRLQPYPIDLEAFAKVPVVSSDQRPVTFLWLGRAVPRKRLDLFLAAFEMVRRRHPDVEARIVGNLREQRSAARLLDRYANSPGIVETASLSREQVVELFGSVHVLVQPSEYENFGFGVAEALAAGRPVVTGRTNGTGYYGGAATFWFDTYDPEAVADAMERAMNAVLTDPKGVSTTARSQARRYFEMDQVAKGVLEAGEAAMRRARQRDRRSFRGAGATV